MPNMASYLQKYEGFIAPVDGHDASKEYDPSAHSTTGPVKITTYNYDWANYDKVISAAGQVAGWQLNQDPNTGNMLGLSTMQGEKFYLCFSRLTILPRLTFVHQSIKGCVGPTSV
jgi:hypothetical protein